MYRVRARRGDGTPGTEPFSASGVQRKQCPKWERFKQPTGHLSSACWGLEEKGFWLSSASPSSRGPERSPAPGSERWGKSSPSPAWCSDPCRNCSARGTMNNCTKKNHRRVTHKPPRTPKNKRGSVGAALGSQCPARRQRMGRKSKIPVGPRLGAAGWDRGREEALGSCLPEPNPERLGLPSGGRYGAILGLAFPSVRALARGAVASKRDVSAAPWLCQIHPCRPSASRPFTKGVRLGLPPPPSFPLPRVPVTRYFFKKQSNKTG